ncbi:MAG: hypothetical protein KC656_32705, partial [Myxococcales bacterium]|nr:hypothetical protein [Myxococcales bacterium]
MQSAPLRPLLLACLAAACLPPGEAGPAVADPSGGTTEATGLPQGVVPADPAGPSAADPASPEGPHPSDPADSADTGPVEVDTGDELPLDTGTPEEAPPADLPPADLGPGFVDLTASVWDGTTFQVYPGGGPGTRDYPATTWVSVGDLDGDGGDRESVVEGMRVDLGVRRIIKNKPAGLVWRADLTERVGLHPGPVVTVVDLDGDGHDDLLRASDRATFGFGDGAGAWTDGALQRGPGLSRLPSLSLAALGDLDQDGWLDLVFGPGDCASSLGVLAAVRTGARTWETRTDLLEEERVVQPYALAVVPAPGGGQDLLA